MKTIKVGINGFGRIGRAFLKVAWERPEIEIVAVNDLGSVENMAYLLKYDTVYHKWDHPVRVQNSQGSNGTSDNYIVIGDKKVRVLAEKEPNKLPWKDLGVDVVVESTGLFVNYEKAKVHLDAGAKKVVISAPVKDSAEALLPPVGGSKASATSATLGETILMGVNEEKFGTCDITSNASCTTNAASPLIAILDEALGIDKALLNTVHGYTASQSIVDGPNKKDFREGRAAAQNIVPSSTGAAIAVTKAFTKLSGLFDGISMRVPVPAGSIVDITFISKKGTSIEEVNEILKKAAQEKRWEGIFNVTEEELVSSDILGNPYGSIADLKLTRVVGGNLIKVMGWYDNEMGYTHTLVEHVIKTGNSIK
ncbi:type I glyceraldehyde-3-phosphate dehydrogenase [Candidatus Nomurabacteria bacterium RIFCSPHIGHO2_01_FULL_39_220]|uniref:Type I glyceraldehyde-3-phosphate dehydrogenase n=1 Tax=Candidatus Nomurabacteria bacterium RIFCSPLOWO2_02_FULL_40_67 TaxID=1801787 RepID=A0A1F6Y403_9BACT|nr:MAG: Glyceraldehyde 3-phosphate dehydrogenase [Parcubacteria group bacterium GW2011_GWA2_40_37]KKS12169.1 MAG: Glyceraldehyde 3-phosphate dehydrogenase [Parcubacteria group bacterium GW2011_GWB1_41_5]KKS71819.1 MAG: Glyceraldehyde 3-phosphate dehydrogenase [Parcubacteria group bacterium GW2011_GWF2_42_7]OGI61885.1 MAG: type I glyceraldehyde-3-phosphate dehydrogenase [Candidatus Nomurabacteria bacterium RBG_16_40_11]OGI69334.1 MAG: type I glyceraldehyde-3-phosphate dehydrogenase [Candidatus N